MGSLLVEPASRFEEPPQADLSDPAVRRALTPHAVKAMLRLAEQWQLSVEQITGLLDVSKSTWHSWRTRPPVELGQDALMRMSLLLGIYSDLQALHSPQVAQVWVTLPNSNRLFGGRTPLEAMRVGGIPAMWAVKALLDGRRGGL